MGMVLSGSEDENAIQAIRLRPAGVSFGMTLLAIPVLLAASLPAPVPAEPPADIVFDVYRNDTPFGEHAVRFDQTAGGDLRVEIDIELEAGFGPITVFRYEHEAEEIWSDGRLARLQAATLKDGDWNRVDVERAGPDTLVSGSVERGYLPPSSHWRGYAAGTGEILNTETGDAMAVEIEDLGMDTVETAAGPVEARHIRMSGTLTVDLWYDADGRWVGCEFEARGQTIRYVLRNG